MTIQPHYIEAARRYLNRSAADRYAAGDMTVTDDAGHEAIAAMAGDVLEEWSVSRTMSPYQRILALDAAVTACEFPGIPAGIKAALKEVSRELDDWHELQAEAGDYDFGQFLKDQTEAVKAMAACPEVFGGE